ADHARSANLLRHRETGRAHLRRHPSRRLHLVKAQLGVAMQVSVEVEQERFILRDGCGEAGEAGGIEGGMRHVWLGLQLRPPSQIRMRSSRGALCDKSRAKPRQSAKYSRYSTHI